VPGMAPSRNPEAIARVIDHALLHPAMRDDDLDQGLELARELNVGAVCVKPCDVRAAARRLEGTDTVVCSVVAFPHGNSLGAIKVQEAKCAIDDGAREIDYVINIARAIAGDFDGIRAEMSDMQALASSRGATLKAIFETAYIDDTTKIRCCKIAKSLALPFVKTSTGFASGVDPQHHTGANIRDVELMVRECSPVCQVKASGGIRTLEKLERFLDAGATRVGTSSTREIINQARRRQAG
jgi:deoxyribose-phosphate aldolase